MRTLCVDCPADRISIHALREESDNRHDSAAQAHILISIHALREESDRQAQVAECRLSDFNPRPPRGERRAGCSAHPPGLPISIHALREESDLAALKGGG